MEELHLLGIEWTWG